MEFFWDAWALVRLAESGDGRWWLAAGIFAGLAALSKFTVALLIPAVLAFMWVPNWRGRWLRSPYPWAAAALALLLFTLPQTAVLLAVVIVLETIGLGTFWAPAMALLSDAADSYGVSQGYAMALINLAWASGQVVGAGGGGALAKTTGDAVPFAISAALCAATLGLMLVRPVRIALPRRSGLDAAQRSI